MNEARTGKLRSACTIGRHVAVLRDGGVKGTQT